MEFRMLRYIMMSFAVLMSTAALADGFTLKGKVTDEESNALELVTVSCHDDKSER